MDDYFLIAEIKAVYGSDGYVIIESFSDFSERFFRLKNVFLEFFGNMKEFVVEDSLLKGKKIVLKFKGVNSSDEAKIFLYKKIFVDQKNSVKLDKDTFFIHDIIGSQVYKESELFGVVEDVLILPANDVYVVKDSDNRKVLVPAVKDFILNFNPVEKRLDLVAHCELLYDDED